MSPRRKAATRSSAARPSADRSPLLTVHIDGAARGNPGPAGVGVVLEAGRAGWVREFSLALGETTNNVAESVALLVALQEAWKGGFRKVRVFSDSELLTRQVTGAYRVKDKTLVWLHVLIRQLLEGLESFEIRHIPREQNKRADRLAARALPRSGQSTFW